jgi:hypothetical protein
MLTYLSGGFLDPRSSQIGHPRRRQVLDALSNGRTDSDQGDVTPTIKRLRTYCPALRSCFSSETHFEPRSNLSPPKPIHSPTSVHFQATL